MIAAVIFIGGLVAALAAPVVVRVTRPVAGWVLAAVPAAMMGGFVSMVPVAAGSEVAVVVPWAPQVGLTFALRVDGLAALFGVLVTGVGALICIYAGAYLKGHRQLGRFYGFLLLFLAAMLGVVMADNLLMLYVCWELTTISSWLLIGFEHEEEEARGAAKQALLVTAAGGLALLAGLVIIGQAAGTFEMSGVLEQRETIHGSGLYGAMLGLVLAGAATKSALVPFHFWLPGAMKAPTPVSAYLHSATMVTLGVFLLARLAPILSETAAWTIAVTGLGGVTAVVAAWLALMQTDLKRLLAYTTISALGMMTLGLGLGGSHGVRAAMALLLAHALYKGALFMVAGAIDHGTGTRDLSEIGGLWRAMPGTAAAAVLAMLSMVGLPPTLGFIAEEALVETTLKDHWGLLPVAGAVLAGLLYTAAGFVAGLRPFIGRTRAPRSPHEGAPSLWGPPLVMGLVGVVLALAPAALDRLLVEPATVAVAGHAPSEHLALWHGVTPSFLLGVAMLLTGALICAAWRPLRERAMRLSSVARLGPGRLYQALDRALHGAADRVDRWLEHGYLPAYGLIVLTTVLALVAVPLWRAGVALPDVITTMRPADAALVVAIFMAAAGAIGARSRVTVIACMSLVGYGVALLFAVFGGPDLAITQVLAETLLTVLVILLLPRLPRFERLSSKSALLRDALLCLAVGGVVTVLLLSTLSMPDTTQVADFYRTHSERAGGRNIVNTILVNFRAADTLGEVTVLAAAAVGVGALMMARRRTRRGSAQPGSLTLTISARMLLPLLLVFALLLLLQGHHAPGGGFAAGLVLASAMSLFLLANPSRGERELLLLRPRTLMAVGLLVAAGSGAVALLAGDPLLEAQWLPWKLELLGGLHPGSPLLLDVGVCLVTAGAVFTMLRRLEERGPWRS